MRKNPFKLYIDRLKNEDVQSISEVVDPSTISLIDTDLIFPEKVTVSGTAYLVKDHIILQLHIQTKIILYCAICNEKTQIPLCIKDFHHTQDISNNKTAIYDYAEEIRNSLLLIVPSFIECNQGNCPHRKNINKYLKQTSSDTYKPFSNL